MRKFIHFSIALLCATLCSNQAFAQGTPARTLPGLPGMYVTGDAVISGENGSATLIAGRPCADVLAMLGSGEWTMAGMTSTKVQSDTMHYGILRRGNTAALAWGMGNDDCGMHVEKLSVQPFAAKGNINAEGNALVYPFGCVQDGEQVGLSMLIAGAGGVLASVSVDAQATGETTIDKDSSNLSVSIGQRDGAGLLDVLAQSMAADAKNKTGVELQAGDAFSGSINITSQQPFAGEIVLDGLVDDNGNAQSLRAGFACNALTKMKHSSAPQTENPSTAEALPDDFPLPAGATAVKYLSKAGLITALVPGSIDDAAAFLKQALPKQGWKLASGSKIGSLVTINATKSGAKLSVTILTDKKTGQTKITAFYPPKK